MLLKLTTVSPFFSILCSSSLLCLYSFVLRFAKLCFKLFQGIDLQPMDANGLVRSLRSRSIDFRLWQLSCYLIFHNRLIHIWLWNLVNRSLIIEINMFRILSTQSLEGIATLSLLVWVSYRRWVARRPYKGDPMDKQYFWTLHNSIKREKSTI